MNIEEAKQAGREYYKNLKVGDTYRAGYAAFDRFGHYHTLCQAFLDGAWEVGEHRAFTLDDDNVILAIRESCEMCAPYRPGLPIGLIRNAGQVIRCFQCGGGQ